MHQDQIYYSYCLLLNQMFHKWRTEVEDEWLLQLAYLPAYIIGTFDPRLGLSSRDYKQDKMARGRCMGSHKKAW